MALYHWNYTEACTLPYSTLVKHGSTLYVSGIVSEDLIPGQVLHGDIEFETKTVLENLESLLAAYGSSAQEIIKIDVYLKTMNDFGGMNKVYRDFFQAPYPARVTVCVAGLYNDVRIEVSAIVSAGEQPAQV